MIVDWMGNNTDAGPTYDEELLSQLPVSSVFWI